MIELPIAWFLGVFAALGGVVATLAGIIYKTLQLRLEAQDKIIEHFRANIDRLSKGCGLQGCHWKNR